jgi:hypothetical protein
MGEDEGGKVGERGDDGDGDGRWRWTEVDNSQRPERERQQAPRDDVCLMTMTQHLIRLPFFMFPTAESSSPALLFSDVALVLFLLFVSSF